MIKISAGQSVSVEINGREYSIDSDEQYRKLLIVLTNPDPSVDFAESDFSIDPGISDPDLEAVATRYAEFFSDFATRRREKLQGNAAEISTGIAACATAAASAKVEKANGIDEGENVDKAVSD